MLLAPILLVLLSFERYLESLKAGEDTISTGKLIVSLLTSYSVAPILVLIIAMWYKKEEQGRRVSWFYVCNALTQIFGGFVAYGVSFTHGKFASWRIFYIAIGALTIVAGLFVCIFLPDSPVKAKRFTDAEKVAVLMRVKNNQR
jgi:ACS family allantoate permease-like MFS transporter